MIQRFLGVLFALALLIAPSAPAAILVWTNTQGGSWHNSLNWFPNTQPGAADTVLITNAGNYRVVITNNVSPASLLIGAGNLVVDNQATLACANMVVTNNAVMTWSNAWLNGLLTVHSNAQLFCSAPGSTTIYSLTLTNHGTVSWISGGIGIGGTPATRVVNNGLWLASSTGNIGTGGGAQTVLVNNGTFRKTGAGTSGVYDFNFINNGLVDVQGGTLSFRGGTTNRFTGTYNTAAGASLQFATASWSDAGGIFTGPGSNFFAGSTLNLQTNVPANLQLVSGDVWIVGTNTFQNAGAITNLTIDGATLRGTNSVSGNLNFNGGSIPEKLTILPGGQFVLATTQNKLLYGLQLINQGTVICGGSVSVGAGGTILNNGLWQFTGDHNVGFGGNGQIRWTNNGTLRKSAGSALAYSQVDANFINAPGGLVESLAGRLVLNCDTNSQIGGTFNAVGIIDYNNGTWTDAGGVMTGAGTNRFNSGTLNLRTNVPAALRLLGGTVVITGTNTFQNSGSITNLTLEGATLAGANTVSGGSLTMNSGTLTGQLTVQPGGQLVFGGAASKFLSTFALDNRGTVQLNGSGVSCGNAVIANSGQWQIPGDFGLSYGGVGTASFTNFGVLIKSAGAGVSDNSLVQFLNQPGAVAQVDAGTLRLPATATNLAGTLRLNGGRLDANGSGLNVAGGLLDGSGVVGANSFVGGTISPGVGGAGQLNFSAGLTLNSNVTLVVDGTGPVPGVSYDALSVTGAVTLANATLQITALPVFPAGTTYTLIANDGTDAISGTFYGLPENASVTVGAQNFRIHYAAGTGNDVTLVRDGTVTGPKLVMQSYATNAWTFSGTNAIPLKTFTIRASTNLLSWTNIGVVTSSVSGAWTFTDTNAWRYAQRFYNTTN